MTKLPEIIPISEFRRGTAEILKRVRESEEPLIITQKGRAAAVMLSIESYEKSQRDRELLHLLARGEAEIEAGEGHDLDSVLAEADAILAEK